MAAEFKIVEEAGKPLGMHPKKFALWLFIASATMIFAALTSAYIVRQSDGNWLVFDLPSSFWITSAIILISSGTMHWAYLAAKRDDLEATKIAISITTVLGLVFLVGQFIAWGDLVKRNVYFVGNPSGSFVYVISGLHGLHIISGVIFLLVVLTATFRYRVHSKNLAQMEMCATYWHFLDALWLYLFVFLLLNR
jgi:cytochrome c oxidase subunit III